MTRKKAVDEKGYLYEKTAGEKKKNWWLVGHNSQITLPKSLAGKKVRIKIEEFID